MYMKNHDSEEFFLGVIVVIIAVLVLIGINVILGIVVVIATLIATLCLKKNFGKKCFFLGIAAVIAGIVILGINAKFSVDKFQGKYKLVSAVIMDYEKHVVSDYTIYQYKENGNFASFKGGEVFNLYRNKNIGKKVFLYRNTKTNKLRESPRISGFKGVFCICIGIYLIYYNYRMNQRRIEISKWVLKSGKDDF
ncbi:MAG: hypothetical protein K2M78_16385 [Lachnospiraceae bacterium]|nr:hypothetical protein [Lachnospiraceae bacterium]